MIVNMVDLIEKDQYVYECGECKHAFKAVEIKLVDPPKDISDVAPNRGVMVMCVDKDGVVEPKHNPTKEAGDKLIACPKCGKPHPEGFNLRGLRR